ncbi:hypothetical protein CK219_18835 [Mesorhizobium sp. WSM4313]|nr:hypothetical protein CK219_18835 [Mesorhizobium sp. WSM4313]
MAFRRRIRLLKQRRAARHEATARLRAGAIGQTGHATRPGLSRTLIILRSSNRALRLPDIDQPAIEKFCSETINHDM